MKLKQVLKKISYSSPPPQGGYTILESLVAMVVVAVMMSAVAPVIVFSVGTRVQARRIELGAQAARSYIDWVRSDPENNAPTVLNQNPNSTDAPTPSGGSLNCPTDGNYCGTAPSYDLGLYCVDGGDGGGCTTDSLTDMVIQTGGYHPAGDLTKGYQLMVRVYRGDAFQETTTLERGTQQSAATNAIGNRRQPVIEIVTEIRPTTDNSFQNYRDRLE